MPIVMKSQKEIVFDAAFPLVTWYRIRSRLKSLDSTYHLKRLGPRPNPIEVSRLYPGTPWTMIPLMVFCMIVLSIWPNWWLVIVASFGIMIVAGGLLDLINRKSQEPYPRIIDRTVMTDAV
jgi:hypothetical protein